MTRPLAIPERQVTALCKGAAKAGFIAEVRIGDVIVRLIPEDRARDDETVDTEPKGYL